MALRIRRGTDAERQTITPKLGELLYVTDTGLIYVGDGTTQGGSLVSASLENDDSPSLSANLNLNGNDIVGNGNINIDGNITATGNINIGDGVEDNVIVGGTISSNLIPTTDTAFDLGSENFRWQNGHFTGMFVDGNVYAGSLSVGDILAQDSTVLYDTNTSTLQVNNIESGSIIGNLKGSVFGDDSSILVDGINNTLNAGLITISENSITNEVSDLTFFSGVRKYTFDTKGALPDPNFGIGDFAIFSASESYTGLNVQSVPNDSTEWQKGEVTGAIIFDASEDTTQKFYSSTVIGTQIDPATYDTDYVSQKFFVLVLPEETITTDSNEAAKHLTFDSYGRLGVNRENAVATVDINGFMLLEPQDEEPYNEEDSSIPDGIVAIADGVNWDPLLNGRQSMVARLEGVWVELGSAP